MSRDAQRYRKTYSYHRVQPRTELLEVIVDETLDWKNSVRAASTGNHALAGAGTTLTIGGVTVVNEDRVLLKDQGTGSQNGIYYFEVDGGNYVLARASDANQNTLSCGAATFVEEGTNAGKIYFLTTTNPITIDSTSLTWTEFSSGGGGGSSPELWFSTTNQAVYTTGSVVIRGASTSVDSPADIGSNVFFHVSGTFSSSLSDSKVSSFGGDVHVSGNLKLEASNQNKEVELFLKNSASVSSPNVNGSSIVFGIYNNSTQDDYDAKIKAEITSLGATPRTKLVFNTNDADGRVERMRIKGDSSDGTLISVGTEDANVSTVTFLSRKDKTSNTQNFWAFGGSNLGEVGGTRYPTGIVFRHYNDNPFGAGVSSNPRSTSTYGSGLRFWTSTNQSDIRGVIDIGTNGDLIMGSNDGSSPTHPGVIRPAEQQTNLPQNGVLLRIRGANATGGSDLAGGSLILSGGLSTGNAAGGSIILGVSSPGSAGSSSNDTRDRLVITGDRIISTGSFTARSDISSPTNPVFDVQKSSGDQVLWVSSSAGSNPVGTDVFMWVSGSRTTDNTGADKVVFGGDVRISGSLSVGTGSVLLTSNDVQFGSSGMRIEKNGNDMKFFDLSNAGGFTLTQLASAGGGPGTGTLNAIPRWSTTSTLGDSGLSDDGTQIYTTTRRVGFGVTTSAARVTISSGVDLNLPVPGSAADAALFVSGRQTGTTGLLVGSHGANTWLQGHSINPSNQNPQPLYLNPVGGKVGIGPMGIIATGGIDEISGQLEVRGQNGQVSQIYLSTTESPGPNDKVLLEYYRSSNGEGTTGTFSITAKPTNRIAFETNNTRCASFHADTGNLVIGRNDDHPNPVGNVIRGPSANESVNIPGGSLTIAGGASSGAAEGGSILFQTSAPNGGPFSWSKNPLETRAVINSFGNVGIGTTSPAARLHVSGSSTASSSTLLAKSGYTNGSSLGVLDVQNNAGNSLLWVSGSGYVGIGTSVASEITNLLKSLGSNVVSIHGPSASSLLFEVNGNFSGSITASDSGMIIVPGSNRVLSLGSDNSVKMVVENDGDVNIQSADRYFDASIASGQGIRLRSSPGNSDAQVLDAYYEKDLVVTLESLNNDLNCSLYAAFQTLKFTRIGRMVTISGCLQVETVTSTGTGRLYIDLGTALGERPSLNSAVALYINQPDAAVDWNNPVIAYADSGTSRIYIDRYDAGQGFSNGLTLSQFVVDDQEFIVSVSYSTN